MKYRKKAIDQEVVEAEKISFGNFTRLCNSKMVYNCDGEAMIANKGDWAIKSASGEVSICDNREFKKTYEKVEEEHKYNPAVVSPPGDTLRGLLDERGMSVLQFILKSSESRSDITFKYNYAYVYGVLNGQKEITWAFAKLLEKIFDTSPDFWMNREKNYRDWLKKQEKKV